MKPADHSSGITMQSVPFCRGNATAFSGDTARKARRRHFSPWNRRRKFHVERRTPKMTSSTSPETVVQRQLDAYNAHDVDALMATYAEDAQQYEYPATLITSGAVQLRERITARFSEPNLHAKLLNRIVMGQVVIDHEEVTRTFPEGTGELELVAIYEVRDDRIATVRFISGQKTLNSQPS